MRRVQLICEGERDADVLRALVDRCLIDADREPDLCRAFVVDDREMHWARSSLQRRAERSHPRGRRGIRNFTRGRSGLDKEALHAFLANPTADLVVMMFDTDGSHRFSRDLSERLGVGWILAVAHPKIEAWGLLLAREDDALAAAGHALKQDLGIDPVQHPHKTSAGGSKKEAKAAFEAVGLTTDRMIELVRSVPVDRFTRREAEAVGLASLWTQLVAWASGLPGVR